MSMNANEARAAIVQSATIPPRRILVVEDEEVNQQVVLWQLRELGYDTHLAVNGKEAVAAFDAGVYDLILMDCQMPAMDGYAATAAIRQRENAIASPRLSHIPIIALTAYKGEAARAKCLAAGMDDYLSKPAAKAQLAAMLQRYLTPAAMPAPAGSDDAEHQTGHPVLELPTLNEATLAQLYDLQGPSCATLVNDLALAFLAQAPELIESLRQATRNAEPASIVRSIHTLRGSSLQMGADRLAGLCSLLQEEAQQVLPQQAQLHPQSRSIQDYAALIAALEAEFATVRSALAPHIQALETDRA